MDSSLSNLLDPDRPLFEHTRVVEGGLDYRLGEEQRELVLRMAGVGVWTVDLVTDELLVDERAAYLFDVSKTGKQSVRDIIDRIHAGDREGVQEEVRRVGRPGQAGEYHQTYRIVRSGGEQQWVEVIGRMLFEKRGGEQAPVRFVGTVRDVNERFATQQALRDSKERLRIALDAAELGAWSMVPPMKALDIDRRSREIFGLEDDPTSRLADFIDRIHPDDRQRVQDAIARSVDPEVPEDAYAISYRTLPAPGDERWVDARGLTFFESEAGARRAVRFTGMLRDVTEQKQTEQALRESEERLAVALESAQLGSWSLDPGTERIVANARCLALFGLSALEGQALAPFVDRMHPDDRARVEEAIARSTAPGGSNGYHVVYRVHPSPGVERWIEAIGQAVFEDKAEAGQTVRFTGILRDVTEKHLTEQALRESEARMRTIFERIDEGYAVVEMIADAKGNPQSYRFLEVNPLFEKLSGLQEPIGRTVHELLPDVEQSWVDMYARVGFGRETVRFEMESPAMGRWYDVFATPVEPHGRFAIVFRDTTERHRAEAEVEEREAELRALNETLEARVAERTQQLEQRNRDLQDFAHAASHDLQEPLRKISIFAGMIADEYNDRLDEQGRYFIDRVQNAAQRLGALVRDLLAYSRVTSRPGDTGEVDLSRVAQTVLGDLELAIRDSGARIQLDPLPTLQADSAQMHQLLQNLIENAVKYRRAGHAPVIRVWAETSDASVSLNVRDDGIGIEPQHRERIFAPFGRLHGRSEYAGSGIGLAVCRRIAERHGGSIAVEGDKGEGSTFVVTLPLHAALADSD